MLSYYEQFSKNRKIENREQENKYLKPDANTFSTERQSNDITLPSPLFKRTNMNQLHFSQVHLLFIM